MHRFFALLLASAATLAAQNAAPESYKNPDLPAERRAADLVSRMTLGEKVLQMQNSAPALPRLGIPAYDWWNEALHGVARAGEATVFPQAIGLAATWDTELMNRIATVISTEARAKYNQAIRDDNHARYFGLTFWSPNINIFRDPRWGRGQETYGEDPFLTGRMAVAFIKGMQGDDPHYYKVIATAKHYAVHSGPEPQRHQFDVKPSGRDLNETYLPAFHAAITEGKADSVMCAYNAVDGLPACVNTDLLVKRLRGDWGFQGYVVSDCGAIADIFNGHKYKPNAAAASAAAVQAGTDLTCGNEYRALADAVKQGLIDETTINRSLERLFTARFKLGMFDPPERVPFSKIPYSEVDSEEHRAVALEAARKSIVLLKNDGHALPLSAAVKKIAVIGPSADDPVALLGNYNGFSKRHVTPLAGIEKQFAGKAEIVYSLGANYTPISAALIPTGALTPPAGNGHGVRAEYFDNADFQGAPKVTRNEEGPFLQGGVVGPDLAATFPKSYSVRWAGDLHPPVSGEYAISTCPSFGPTHPSRVFIDDRELIPAGTPAAIHATFDASRSYKLRLDYNPPQRGVCNVQIAWIPPAEPLLSAATDAVKKSDAAIVFAGLNPNLEGEEMRVSIPGFAGGDRTDLNLPELQEKLIESAAATGKPLIVVLTSGSALSAKYAAQHAAALLELWYDGEETGTAIAETLAGANNPAGRLPVTFYSSVDQLPPFEDYSMNNRTYRYFKGEPLFGFGFGLSYSEFAYSRLQIRRTATGAQVTARVTNKSGPEGDEVAQLYLEGDGSAQAAIRQLRGFQRIHLKPGESRDIQFTIPAGDLPKGRAKVTVGGGQPVAGVAHVDGTI